MENFISKIKDNMYVLLNKETNEVLEHYTKEDGGKKLKELFDNQLQRKFIVEKMQFKHLSFEEKQEELLHRIEHNKYLFDQMEYDGRMCRDVFVLSRQEYEFVIDALKGEKETGVKGHQEADSVDDAIALLTEKEKLALKEALTVIYLNDRSDYINGLWDVIRAIIGAVMDEDDFNIEQWLKKLRKDLGVEDKK